MQPLVQLLVLFGLCLTGSLSNDRRDLLQPGSPLVDENQRIFDWSNLAGTSHLGEVKGRRASSFVRIGKRTMSNEEDPFQSVVFANSGRGFRPESSLIWQKSADPMSRQFDYKRRAGTVDSKKLSSFVRLGKRAAMEEQSEGILGRNNGDSEVLLLNQ